jgi:hypothetical protein
MDKTPRYHVGTRVVCRMRGCPLFTEPRYFTGTGIEDSDRALDYANRHEARNPHHCSDVSSIYSTEPLKG